MKKSREPFKGDEDTHQGQSETNPGPFQLDLKCVCFKCRGALINLSRPGARPFLVLNDTNGSNMNESSVEELIKILQTHREVDGGGKMKVTNIPLCGNNKPRVIILKRYKCQMKEDSSNVCDSSEKASVQNEETYPCRIPPKGQNCRNNSTQTDFVCGSSHILEERTSSVTSITKKITQPSVRTSSVTSVRKEFRDQYVQSSLICQEWGPRQYPPWPEEQPSLEKRETACSLCNGSLQKVQDNVSQKRQALVVDRSSQTYKRKSSCCFRKCCCC